MTDSQPPVEIKNNQSKSKSRGGPSGAGRPRKGATPVTDALRRGRVEQLVTRVNEQDEEIARLKGLLAKANDDIRRLTTHPGGPVTVLPRLATLGVACIHDAVYGVCRKLGCRPK